MNTKKMLLSSAVFLYTLGNAQQSAYFQNTEEYQWDLSENLYATKVFNAAQYNYTQQYFYNQTLSESKKEAAYFYDTIIGVLMQKKYGEKGLESFMKDYPQSAYFAQAYLPLADYYLGKRDFAKALESLKKVNQYQLSKEENTQYILKLGYAQFMTGNTKSAIHTLEDAYTAVNESEKGSVAYMLGHLYYAKQDNSKAFKYFDSIKNDPKYSQLVQPYYVQLYYNQKDYDKAISEGQSLLNKNVSDSYKQEVHKIIGESYFMKNDYSSAYPHLKEYIQGQQNPSESDLYEMGFVAAQLGKYDEAVSYYNQLLNSKSAMAQNAYYQLGNAYLQTKKKQEALSAFRSAYEMSYDPIVQQYAHEQYAKLSYEIGNPFESAPGVIQKYIAKYPKSEKTEDLRKLLVKSYLYSGNYKETLDAIDKLPQQSAETNKINQEVSFLLGTEEFNKGNFNDAENYFKRSLAFSINQDYYYRTLYWLGQTYYQKGNYADAIDNYKKLENQSFEEKQQLNYDLGYAYFKSKDFENAKKYFEAYLKAPKTDYKNDAELRLADSYYALNQLDDAINIYDKAENLDDYTLYQKALALGFKGDFSSKINQLKSLISKFPKSDFVDDAWYEIGTAYAAQNDYKTSNDYFAKVISQSDDKNLIANAKIYKAQNMLELNDTTNALQEFQKLGVEYKNTAYAEKIVQAAQPAFAKNGDTTGYENFANSLGVKLKSSEIDELNLGAAKNYFSKKDYSKAIPLYEKYLKQNPTGEGLYQAQYELGESLYQTQNTAKALLVLQSVATVENDYKEDALTRMAQIYLSQNNTVEAEKTLRSLETTSNSSIKNFSQLELMKIYAHQNNFDKAEKYADLVLANSKNTQAVQESAKAIKARVAMDKGKDKDAKALFATLEKSSNSEVAAEAMYAKAYYQNKAKSYKASNETIFKLANNYASEEYWGAKSLLLMAQNYIGLKDNYQASYTCDQIINNYKDLPEIVSEAQSIKKAIK
ncbi:MAG: tetratricopeptide repeat protein [Bacteroidetes bacterium]|nr:tetratricopeptide repeat protein [Bacteroidota bacterium]